MKRHVALVGFMASGKSTIGRRLARKLGCAFFDTDDLIVRAHGELATIFASEGEAAFRRYERAAIREVLDNGDNGVVALGGGALTVAENRRLLCDRSYRVFIKVSPERILARLRRSRQVRPLLARRPSLAAVQALYQNRMPYYAAAEHVVEADLLSCPKVVEDIVAWLQGARIELGILEH